MIKEAAKYLLANTATRQELINHYNQFCLPQVKKERLVCRQKLLPREDYSRCYRFSM